MSTVGEPGLLKRGRRPLAIANWKMTKRLREAEEYVTVLLENLPGVAGRVELWLAPPFTAISRLAETCEANRIWLAAQNCHSEEEGAYTGEIAASMVRDAGARAVILGHSERRQMFHEGDELIGRKLLSADRAQLAPVLCIGETLSEREAGQTEVVLERQLRVALGTAGSAEESLAGSLILAYEPVWAIGTGQHASAEQAQAACAFLRRCIADVWPAAKAPTTTILYGGSVTADSADDVLAGDDIDGALVGGASRDPKSFASIVSAVKRVTR